MNQKTRGLVDVAIMKQCGSAPLTWTHRTINVSALTYVSSYLLASCPLQRQCRDCRDWETSKGEGQAVGVGGGTTYCLDWSYTPPSYDPRYVLGLFSGRPSLQPWSIRVRSSWLIASIVRIKFGE